MKDVIVQSHVYQRWKERIDPLATNSTIRSWLRTHFRSCHVQPIQAVRGGKEIVCVKGFIFIIRRSNSTTRVITTYGHRAKYDPRKFNAADNGDPKGVATYRRWLKQEKTAKYRRGSV